ncbi:trans-aconitate 2-methyltransferase [Actinoplanes sp. DH11]|uniref:class I SAM-dependent methyltransferase n=1 Tax=Actinoplanes sp. DH11 TaxID=2857011 RepID=UPI001E2E6046|nr:class I SAM-dependent methyltransferase [Actinoplanes sp. DH11]
MRNDPGHWAEYLSRQGERPIRELCRRAMTLAGPGAGRTAIDLGCGAGRETKALLDDGWRVLAHDSEPGTEPRLLRAVGGRHEALGVRVCAFENLTTLPGADLIHASYSLPYQQRPSFDRLWTLMRSNLRPGGRLAVNLFGDHDSWAGDQGMTFLREHEVRSLLDGLEIEHWDEEDAPGEAFSGPKHWHVFTVIARNSAAAGLTGDGR